MHLHCVKRVRIRSYSGSHFFRIWTEYGEIRSISLYSVWMRENANQNNSEYGLFFTQSCFVVVLFLWRCSASRVGGIFLTIMLFFENNSRLYWLTPVQILALSYNKITNRSVISWSSSPINCNDDALQTRIYVRFTK